ncbi:MAG: 2-dehydro-3-deoxyphosphooctonate aldolase [Alphaproteobacteria bacterium TMED89]|nr:MAG: 2-dehydro-3-deoxyphosphooctonate aldolase [Alphaproteobacteria bacterium TMED89]
MGTSSPTPSFSSPSRRRLLLNLGSAALIPAPLLMLSGCDAVESGPLQVGFSREFNGEALATDLKQTGAALGDPIMLRVFKQERQLETWVQPGGEGAFKLFRVYPICYYSGKLGPKVKQGDMQSPEGFYYARANHVRAQSQYHRAIDFGYPNTYDRAHGYTGSELLIHGNCVSSGCYAMTDPLVDELYRMTRATTDVQGQGFWIHAFPFRMTQANMNNHKDSAWMGFWTQLKSGYDAFELTRLPPSITVKDAHYVVEPAAATA